MTRLVLALLVLAAAGAAGARQPRPDGAAPSDARVLAGPFAAEQGHAWVAEVPADWTSDGPGEERASRLILLEDGRALGPAHAEHAAVRAHGAGRYSHWRGSLIFSTSDNSDPNTNGRVYAIARAADAGGGEALYPRRPAVLRVTLAPPFASRAGRAWIAAVPADWPSDGPDTPRRSPLRLLEDRVALGPAHALHARIEQEGGGLYSHWRGELVFSTSDGSDPNENGRTYVAELAIPEGIGEYGYEAFPPLAPFARLEAAAREAALEAGRSRPLRPGAPTTIWWYTIDALRAEVPFAEHGGAPVMPALAAFAEQAVVFEHAYVTAPNTKLSTASMFTGLWPTRHGVTAAAHAVWPEGSRHADPLDARFETLPEMLLAHGFETWTHRYTIFLDEGAGLLQGFARRDLAAGEVTPLETTSERMFAYEHLLGLHAPYAPSASARAALGVAPPRAVDPASTDWYRGTLDADARAELRAHYLAEGRDADERLGRRLAWLRETGRWDGALVIVTSDHGEEFVEHGATGHSIQLYEEVVRVPLIVKFPSGSRWARRHGERIPHRVRLVDLYPTILELVTDARPPHELDGASLLPILAGEETDPRARDVVLRMALAVPLEARPGARPLMTVDGMIRGRLKALFGYRMSVSQDPARHFAQGEWFAELYDLADDPREQRTLLPARVDDFHRLAGAHRASARPLAPWREAAGAAPGPAAGDDVLPPELEARLRELGYLR